MASENTLRNVVSFTVLANTSASPSEPEINVTSVIEVTADPSNEFLEDGSDNDPQPTVRVPRARKFTGTVRVRDPLQAQKLNGLVDRTIVVKLNADVGSDCEVTMEHCATQQFGLREVWDAEFVAFNVPIAGSLISA